MEVLPQELLVGILELLEPLQLAVLQRVCSRWHVTIIHTPALRLLIACHNAILCSGDFLVRVNKHEGKLDGFTTEQPNTTLVSMVVDYFKRDYVTMRVKVTPKQITFYDIITENVIYGIPRDKMKQIKMEGGELSFKSDHGFEGQSLYRTFEISPGVFVLWKEYDKWYKRIFNIELHEVSVRIHIVGLDGCGKTSLCHYFVEDKIVLNYKEGRAFRKNDDLDLLSIGTMFVFDITSTESFEYVKLLLGMATKRPIYLVGNKSDKRGSRKVLDKEAKQCALLHKCKYFEVSAITGQGVADCFDTIIRNGLSKRRTIEHN
mmetsp:Transcript_5735/g.6228  ORF Transcript_5735/g.6228 Transcript_5735/m.6228 type:complete len:318 (-) Transcript_5735:35-988(-)